MGIQDLIRKSENGEQLSRNELLYLLSRSPDSSETYLVMAEANRVSKELTGNRAEVHAQLALNLAPCPCNCAFCAFAQKKRCFLAGNAFDGGRSRRIHTTIRKRRRECRIRHDHGTISV